MTEDDPKRIPSVDEGAKPETAVDEGAKPETAVDEGAKPKTAVDEGAKPKTSSDEGAEPSQQLPRRKLAYVAPVLLSAGVFHMRAGCSPDPSRGAPCMMVVRS